MNIEIHGSQFCQTQNNLKIKKLKAYALTESRSYTRVEYEFADILYFYRNISFATDSEFDSLRNRTTTPYQEEILRCIFNGNNSNTPLRKYELLVQQAGHLG